MSEKVTVREALEALGHMVDDERDMVSEGPNRAKLVQFIAERAVALAPKDNTGDPCPYCGEKLKTLIVEEVKDTDQFRVQVSTTTNKKGLKNLIDMLKMFTKDR